MGFLDNLEESVKSAEARDQAAETGEREQSQREIERARARAAAPWAEKLRNSPFTAELLRQLTRIGHTRRTKIHMAWIGLPPYLRLEAREKRLELRPTPEGIVAAFFEREGEARSKPVDLQGSPEDLARSGWADQPISRAIVYAAAEARPPISSVCKPPRSGGTPVKRPLNQPNTNSAASVMATEIASASPSDSRSM